MKQYSSLIVTAIRADREKLRVTDPGYVYLENHHIWPKCFGRDDRDQNLVLLTFSEHIEAHILLAKLYPEHFGIRQTPGLMLSTRGLPVSVEVATEARELAAATSSEQWSGEDNPNKKPENRAKISKRNSLRGLLGTHPFQKPEIVAATAERGRVRWSSDSNPAKKPENQAAQSERAKKQVQCPYCCAWGTSLSMSGRHFDNCKLLLITGACCNLAEKADWLPCQDCYRFFTSSRGLTRHRNASHLPVNLSDSLPAESLPSASSEQL